MRLNPKFRLAVYAAFTVLFLTGAVWLAADVQKEGENGEIWQQVSAWMLMLHGGGAMIMLMLLGALVPLHIRRAWRSRQNLVSGSVMIALSSVLIFTAFGLYYLGSEATRPWISWTHIVFGFVLPALILLHVVLGRRSRV